MDVGTVPYHEPHDCICGIETGVRASIEAVIDATPVSSFRC